MFKITYNPYWIHVLWINWYTCNFDRDTPGPANQYIVVVSMLSLKHIYFVLWFIFTDVQVNKTFFWNHSGLKCEVEKLAWGAGNMDFTRKTLFSVNWGEGGSLNGIMFQSYFLIFFPHKEVNNWVTEEMWGKRLNGNDATLFWNIITKKMNRNNHKI